MNDDANDKRQQWLLQQQERDALKLNAVEHEMKQNQEQLLRLQQKEEFLQQLEPNQVFREHDTLTLPQEQWHMLSFPNCSYAPIKDNRPRRSDNGSRNNVIQWDQLSHNALSIYKGGISTSSFASPVSSHVVASSELISFKRRLHPSREGNVEAVPLLRQLNLASACSRQQLCRLEQNERPRSIRTVTPPLLEVGEIDDGNLSFDSMVLL